MKKEISTGDLYYRVAFLKRAQVDDGYGNTVGSLIEQFQCRAAFRHLRGGESVMAGRLEGKHTQIITVRASSLTRQITTDWIVRDVRAPSDEFNIRDVTHETDRAWISLLCEKGVAV